MISGSKPQRIEPEFHNKIWGSPLLAPWFESPSDQLTGEVWFPAGDLLIKFLFTTENLSVQVHPPDEFARTHENSRGKTEMWHILRADPGARIALGFRHPISPGQLISSSQSGEIMDLLNWIEVRPGDTYFIPAGTVHAIGGGIALCEIQQHSDITYRLYDYGRDRPLHLQQASEVADLGTHPGRSAAYDMGDGVECLVECRYFRTCLASVSRTMKLNGSRFLIVLESAGLANGLPVSQGQVLTGEGQWIVEPESAAAPLRILLTGPTIASTSAPFLHNR